MISATPVTFADRRAAGEELATAIERSLGKQELSRAVVCGLARGGVAVAAVVALRLGLPLTAVAVRKIGHPWHPEFALGAVASGGEPYLRDELADSGAVAQLVSERRREADALARRLQEGLPEVVLSGRPAILVDDGLATGASMIAAVRWAKSRGASAVTVAVPVGAHDSCVELRREADRVLCLQELEEFYAVGYHYRDFDPVSERTARALLAAAGERSG